MLSGLTLHLLKDGEAEEKQPEYRIHFPYNQQRFDVHIFTKTAFHGADYSGCAAEGAGRVKPLHRDQTKRT